MSDRDSFEEMVRDQQIISNKKASDDASAKAQYDEHSAKKAEIVFKHMRMVYELLNKSVHDFKLPSGDIAQVDLNPSGFPNKGIMIIHIDNSDERLVLCKITFDDVSKYCISGAAVTGRHNQADPQEVQNTIFTILSSLTISDIFNLKSQHYGSC